MAYGNFTTTRTFVIFNDGLSDLTLGPVTFTGTHAANFSVSVPPVSPVPSGGTTHFEVTFNPSAMGLRTATVNVPSNDVDESTFDFAIEGTGVPSQNADLETLTLSHDILDPAFASGTTSYTADVANATSSLTVTPTRAEANATIDVRVNEGSFAPVTSGSASGSLALNIGANSVEVRVTAEDTTNTKTYTISVTRDKGAQTITFANPGDQQATATVNLSATGGASGNAVTFAVTSGPASISGGNVLSFTGAGSVTITASQAGNSDYHDATPVARTFTVSLVPQTITFSNPGSRFISEVLTLAATGGGSGSGVTYEVLDGPGVIANGNELSFTGGGDVRSAPPKPGTISTPPPIRWSKPSKCSCPDPTLR